MGLEMTLSSLSSLLSPKHLIDKIFGNANRIQKDDQLIHKSRTSIVVDTNIKILFTFKNHDCKFVNQTRKCYFFSSVFHKKKCSFWHLHISLYHHTIFNNIIKDSKSSIDHNNAGKSLNLSNLYFIIIKYQNYDEKIIIMTINCPVIKQIIVKAGQAQIRYFIHSRANKWLYHLANYISLRT